MQVYSYNQLVFRDLDTARDAAQTELQKKLGDRQLHYVWDPEPICSFAALGVIWRGISVKDGLRFTADIVEQRVD